MQKDIDTMVMENVFGIIEINKNKSKENDERKGFYIDSFYVTGMSRSEYDFWASGMKKFYGNYSFWQ